MSNSSRTFLTVWLAVILALVAFTTPTFAQQVFGSIYGTVTDASGAAVANAKVTITDASKGTKFEVTTDANGNYNKGQFGSRSLQGNDRSAWFPARGFE